MRILRILNLIISILFLLNGMAIFITPGNIGTYIAIIIGTLLLLIFIFFNKIILAIKNTVIFKIAFVLFLLFALLFIVVEGLIIWSENKSYDKKSDAVIILGAGLWGDAVSLNLQYRLDAAIEYLNKYPDTLVVVSGGQGPDEWISEAEAMKRYLIKKGINESNIIKEDKSTNTAQNFKFSKEILDEIFSEDYTITYATSNFHVFRSGQIAKRNGLNAYGIAAKDVWYLSVANHLREFVSVMNMWLGVFK